jgi:Protein of unknown function (DUF2721)
MEAHITDITHVIQLAVAPVFLLTAIGTLITAMNNRLGRIIDRRRILRERIDTDAAKKTSERRHHLQPELDLLSRRSKLIYASMLAAGLGALLVCLVVAGAFVGALLSVDLSRVVAVFFILAMFAVIGSISLFLREVFLAVHWSARHG